MKLISYVDTANRVSGATLTDLSTLDFLRKMSKKWGNSIAITHTMEVSSHDAKRWEAEGLSVMRKDS